METFVNKVAESGIITIDLSTHIPSETTIAAFDLKPYLFRELIVKEKDFRASLKDIDWKIFQNKHVAVYCSTEAIIPMWAYMLVTTYLSSISASVYFGTTENLINHLTIKSIEDIDIAQYIDQRVVIKGCGDVHISAHAYIAITKRIVPVVKSLMYGEPCSTVPVYKKK
jgi:hypothetical protein